MAESEEELNSLLLRVKEEHQRASLRLNIKKAKIMASGSITSWQTEGGKVEIEIFFLGLQKSLQTVTAAMKSEDGLLLGRKAMTDLDSMLKSRDITLLTKVCVVKAMVFPVVTYGFESWTIKKAERQRIDAFGLWCWRRFLKVPWTARRSNPADSNHVTQTAPLSGLSRH